MKSRSSLLYLGQGDFIDFRTPCVFQFASDEIEVWLSHNGDEICLLKDSFKHVVLSEVLPVFEMFCSYEPGQHQIPVDYINQYNNLCNATEYNKHILEYLLFENINVTTWLYGDSHGNAVISIVCKNPQSIDTKFYEYVSYCVKRDVFQNWCNTLFTSIDGEMKG